MKINAWDINAKSRHKQIIEGQDLSFDSVLSPTIIKLLRKIDNIKTHKVLDVGCGSGVLTNKVSDFVRSITGVDPSKSSIELAKNEFGNKANLNFICSKVETLKPRGKYHIVYSNMTFHAIRDIKLAFTSIASHLDSNGLFIFSIPHPCFWVNYRKKIGHDDYKNFSYKQNSSHQIRFSISTDRNPLPGLVPYFHRPIEYYSSKLLESGFEIARIYEPSLLNHNDPNIKANWENPHFMFFSCVKSKRGTK